MNQLKRFIQGAAVVAFAIAFAYTATAQVPDAPAAVVAAPPATCSECGLAVQPAAAEARQAPTKIFGVLRANRQDRRANRQERRADAKGKLATNRTARRTKRAARLSG